MKIKMHSAHGFIYENSIGQTLSIQFGPHTEANSRADSSQGLRFIEAEKVGIALLDAEGYFICQPWNFVPAEFIPTAMLLFRYNDFIGIEKMLKTYSIRRNDEEAYESWDHSDDADALASAGWGTDEDYGGLGCGDD